MKTLKQIIIALVLILISQGLFAQGPPLPPGSTSVPLDGGLLSLLLLASGGAISYRKLQQKKKN